MDLDISERVGRSRRSRPPRKQPRESLAESPSSLTRSSQKRKKRRKETFDSQYYSVKQILDEKIEHGDTLYLIDWEDNAETGESYTPTWEPHDNVTRQAIREWEARARQDKATRTKLQGPREEEQEPPSSPDPYPSSQPIRTAKRQRANQSSELSSSRSSQPTTKKPRRAGTAETARFQSVSQETAESESKAREIKDSYEEEQSQSTGSRRIRVVVPIDQEFDREAYAKVSVVSSQPSQTTQVSHTSQSSRLSYNLSQSQLRTPIPRHPFLWDEEDDGVPIVLDSQDTPGSSSYKPTETPSSKTGATTRPNTDTTTETDIASWRSSGGPSASAGTGLRYSEPLSHSFRAKSLDSESEPASSQVESSLPGSNIRTAFSTTVEDSQESPRLPQPGISDSKDPISSFGTDFRSQASIIASSSHLPSSSENLLPQLIPSSEESPRILKEVQVRQLSIVELDQTSQQFLTQLPIATQDDSGSWNVNLHVTPGSYDSEAVPTSKSAQSQENSRTVGRESVPPRSAGRTQSSVSTFEATPQAAQIQPTSSSFSTQSAQNSVAANRNSPTASQYAISQAPTILALDKLDANAQKSQNRISTSGNWVSNSTSKRVGDLLEASDNILPSVEHIVGTVFSPASSMPSPLASGLKNLSRYRSPSRISSPSAANMADSAMSEMSTAERLRIARQTAAENTMARQRATRTASAIPHTPPPPAPPAVNQMLPVRETAPETTVISPPPPKASPDSEVLATSLQILPLGENVYAVPLPMVALARDVYEQEFINHRAQRRAFLNDDVVNTQTVADIDFMIDHLVKICDHQDLLLQDSATQQMETDHRQARWAENISTKCIFLAGLLDALTSSDAHVIILARPGRMIDILEALFRTRDYVYTRPDRYSSHSEQSHFKISLLPTDGINRAYDLQPASIVVVFDTTFVPSPYLESLRKDPSKMDRIAPRIHLVVTHSIEHLDLCFPKSMNHLDRKAILVNSLSHVRADMGKLEGDDDLSPLAAAKAVAQFLNDEVSSQWPVPPMPSIEGIEPVSETLGEPNSSEAHHSGSTTQSYDLSSAPFQPAFKRPLLDEEDSESSKRQRLTPVGGISSSGVDVSPVNETTMDTSGDINDTGLETAATIVDKVDSLDTAQADQISSLLEKISELEIQLQSRDATESSLQQINQHLEAKVQDYEKSIARIQPKYQEALNERGQAQHDIIESIARETSIRQKLDARTADLAKVKEEKALADAALIDARATLASSSIPEVAELQKLKDELNAAKGENAKLQKKFSANISELEYMRKNYQTASSAAAEMRTELDDLKTLNETLSRKASADTVEIHRIQASSNTKEYINMIEAAKREKAMLEWQLEKRNGELQGLLNGRRPTRGSSVPKSPRMGTMSPGQSRPMSRVLGGAGSRGTSPAPGGAEGQFKGPGTFGEALFPSQVSNRFGTHLS